MTSETVPEVFMARLEIPPPIAVDLGIDVLIYGFVRDGKT
jgi:hypothetical protein